MNANVIYVMSGKGGVGKTTVSVNLAYSLMKKGFKVGILDADIHGPNVPEMIGLDTIRTEMNGENFIPHEVEGGLKAISIGLMIAKQDSIIWRGPMKHNMINKFITSVEWGDIDYLVVDLPPGTGDEALSAIQLLKESNNGALIVSTPQKVSIADTNRSIDFCKKMDVKVIGVVENMSGGIFGKGTIEPIAEYHSVKYLGEIPMSQAIVESSENGTLYVNTEEGNKAFEKIVEKTIASFE